MIGQGRERSSGLTGKVLIADLSGGYKCVFLLSQQVIILCYAIFCIFVLFCNKN